MTDASDSLRPIKILIAALGGEGGGVLASWLHTAAIAEGHLAHGTSIPGVAQRTGATTYYIEIVPGAGGRHTSTRPPVLALNAAPGEVDLVVASELLEGTRALQAGFVTPDRTTFILSTARVYTVDEKSAMGDGRLESQRMTAFAEKFARRAFIADLGAIARDVASPISSVLLGAIAASGALPFSEATFRRAITAEGKAVEANLRGFEGGLGAFRPRPTSAASAPQAAPAPSADPRFADLPAAAHAVLAEGVARLTDYQDAAYAEDFLATVRRFAGMPGADAVFVRELARHLALRMSVEDVIRVAQLKLRESRLDRVRGEAKAAASDIVDVTEYLKPGPDEILGLLPPRLGRALLARVPHTWSWAMTVRTTRLSGFIRLKGLASLRRVRRRTLRFAEEAAWRRRWLGLVEEVLLVDPAAALEVVQLAALVRGYGDTYRRGLTNFDLIVARLIAPMLAGRLPRSMFAVALLQARIAATRDPEGASLAATLDAIEAAAAPARAAAE
ncbi:MAG: indolepyruvate oxidoreductase subunit beta family protein [Hyphomicrobiales bacterium]|nr:MAG: indolepyruvate oxidoreductase subunit beta family protein [Hyphomicrobiales bacterium]